MTKDRLIEYLDSADFNSVKTLLLQLQSHEIEVTALAEVLTDVLHKAPTQFRYEQTAKQE